MMDIVLVGIAYIIMVYFMVILMKRKNFRFRNDKDDDDNDGGIAVSPNPDLDLPPGISLPDNGGGKKLKKEDTEDVLG